LDGDAGSLDPFVRSLQCLLDEVDTGYLPAAFRELYCPDPTARPEVEQLLPGPPRWLLGPSTIR
jgi:hypothetical protein